RTPKWRRSSRRSRTSLVLPGYAGWPKISWKTISKAKIRRTRLAPTAPRSLFEGVEQKPDHEAGEESPGNREQGIGEEHPGEENDAEADAHADRESGKAAVVPLEQILESAHESARLLLGRRGRSPVDVGRARQARRLRREI